jgi:hypothetical protein
VALLAGSALAVSVAVAPAGASTAGGLWRIQRSADVTVPAGRIESVSCVSPGVCTAVGYYRNTSGVNATLAKVWNGTTWTRQPTPDQAGAQFSVLEGVSCTAADSCEAVGYSEPASGVPTPFAESWNGTSWSLQPVPSLAGATFPELLAVSCPSARFCEAVGTYQDSSGPATLAEVWRGASWQVQPTPGPTGAAFAELAGVSCTSARSCEAVGYSYPKTTGGDTPIAESWDGTSWRAQPIPGSFAGPTAVSCVPSGFCEAVGSHTDVLGNTLNLAEERTGTSWKVQATPQPPHSFQAADATLDSVSCVSADFCEAVGYSSASFGSAAMMWNGTSWQAQTIPGSAELRSVSCASADFCEAVSGTQADVWNGTSWSAQSTAAGSPVLGGVSCVSADFCEAAGGGSSGHNAEVRHGSGWVLQATPTPRNGVSPGIGEVSCVSADFCEAAGGYDHLTHGGQEVTLAEMWNGATWAIQRTPNPKTSVGDSFSGVSCTSTTSCTAVGGYSTDSSASDFTVAQVWNGTSWSAQRTPLPGAASPGGYLLAGVSCGAAGTCTAAGASNPNALPATLVETGD